eukprot:838270-Amphidinium_carterae.1
MSRLRMSSRSANSNPHASGCPGTSRAQGSVSWDTKPGASQTSRLEVAQLLRAKSWSLTDRKER